MLLGGSGGDFAPLINFSTGEFPISIAVGDLNHDDDPDLAIIERRSSPSCSVPPVGHSGRRQTYLFNSVSGHPAVGSPTSPATATRILPTTSYNAISVLRGQYRTEPSVSDIDLPRG